MSVWSLRQGPSTSPRPGHVDNLCDQRAQSDQPTRDASHCLASSTEAGVRRALLRVYKSQTGNRAGAGMVYDYRDDRYDDRLDRRVSREQDVSREPGTI
jgi:hypothetical protein